MKKKNIYYNWKSSNRYYMSDDVGLLLLFNFNAENSH